MATNSNAGCNKIWVGSIPPGTTREALGGEFLKYGAVVDVFLREDAKAQGRMWGFVTFSEPHAAVAAVAAHQQSVSNGSGPVIEEPLEVRYSRSADGGFTSTKLWVGSIPAHTTQDVFRNTFERF